LLSGAFLSFAIVIGEYVLAAFLARPAFGPYMALMGQNRAYEPSALAIISLALTWAAIGLIQILGRGQERSQLTGVR
jgi:putative spermidine/putrescine transport system permease protein